MIAGKRAFVKRRIENLSMCFDLGRGENPTDRGGLAT
jgi:hypothetical protein